MSVQQYFSEVEAVVSVLQSYVESYEGELSQGWMNQGDEDEFFTATWQAAELLARAHAYITAQINAEMAMAALNLPDVQTEAPKTPKKGRLYGPNGMPL